MSHVQISSPNNQSIKDLVRLTNRKGERASEAFVVEGEREVERAISCGFILQDLFYCSEFLSIAGRELLTNVEAGSIFSVSPPVFAKIAIRERSAGLVAVFASRSFELNDLLIKDHRHGAFLIAAENVEKPGNLGALLRTADAVGADGFVALGGVVDPWNPNCVRASLGAVFSVPVVCCESPEFFNYARERRITTVGAALSHKSMNPFQVDFRGPIALVLGSEAFGLSEGVISACDAAVMLPMKGLCDSLNVSVAGGVLAYEVLRQRGF
jgi:TrmH family RNA methyltransferase